MRILLETLSLLACGVDYCIMAVGGLKGVVDCFRIFAEAERCAGSAI